MEWKGQRILVTGGAGFIGSHLTERLLGLGARVTVLDNFDDFYDPAIKRGNLAQVQGHPGFELFEADIREASEVGRILRHARPQSVVHLAARAGVRPSIVDPVLYSSVNVEGTARLLEACRLAEVGSFVFGSTSSVYGNNRKVPFAEQDPVDHPISPYAATKKAGEVLCHVYHHLYGMRVACVRLFTVYGPRQRPEMAIHKFARALLEGAVIEQYGDGGSARDYTFVSDIVEGILAAVERSTGYHVWNLGGSRTITLRDLLERLAGLLDAPLRVRVLPEQPGDVERTWADISKSKRELEWEPEVSLEEGLERFARWLREQPGRSE